MTGFSRCEWRLRENRGTRQQMETDNECLDMINITKMVQSAYEIATHQEESKKYQTRGLERTRRRRAPCRRRRRSRN